MHFQRNYFGYTLRSKKGENYFQAYFGAKLHKLSAQVPRYSSLFSFLYEKTLGREWGSFAMQYYFRYGPNCPRVQEGLRGGYNNTLLYYIILYNNNTQQILSFHAN